MILRRDLNLRNRRSLRLPQHDYARGGVYFVTVVTAGRVPLFGDVRGGVMHLNEAGRMITAEWRAIASHVPTMSLDAHVVMPNHIHGIVVIAAAPPVAPAAVPTSQSSPVGAPLVGALATTRDDPSASGVAAGEHRAGGAAGAIGGDGAGGGGGGMAGGHRAGANDGIIDGQSGAGRRGTAGGEHVDGPGVEDRAPTRGAPTLGDVIGAFKSRTTVAYVGGVTDLGWPAFEGRLWQRNYYEHIIRHAPALDPIRLYIADNPRHWASDRFRGPAGGGG